VAKPEKEEGELILLRSVLKRRLWSGLRTRGARIHSTEFTLFICESCRV
jgi:hypothetical protein